MGWYWDNGKANLNGNYYNGLYGGYIWGYIGLCRG